MGELPILIPSRNRSCDVGTTYSHSGMGFQSSWGSASIVLALLEGAIQGVGNEK